MRMIENENNIDWEPLSVFLEGSRSKWPEFEDGIIASSNGRLWARCNYGDNLARMTGWLFTDDGMSIGEGGFVNANGEIEVRNGADLFVPASSKKLEELYAGEEG